MSWLYDFKRGNDFWFFGKFVRFYGEIEDWRLLKLFFNTVIFDIIE